MKNSHLNHQSQQGRHLEVERRERKERRKMMMTGTFKRYGSVCIQNMSCKLFKRVAC